MILKKEKLFTIENIFHLYNGDLTQPCRRINGDSRMKKVGGGHCGVKETVGGPI